MTEYITDANDGSVQEVAVIDKNPHGTDSVTQPVAGVDYDRDVEKQGESANQELDATSSLLTDKQEAATVPAKIQTGMVATVLLRPYARNTEIYQDREDALFTENIRKNGVLTDLVVTVDGEVLGGNRRWREANRLGLVEVPVKVVACKTEDEKMLRVLDDNVQREKTKVELAREYVERLKVEARAAAQRKVEAGRKPKGRTEEVKTLTPPAGKKGKARDHAAKELNLSGVTAEKGRKVLEAVLKARAQGATEVADELLLKLNDQGFHAAFERAKALKLIVTAAKKAVDGKTAVEPKVEAVAPKNHDLVDHPDTRHVALAGTSAALPKADAMVEDMDDSDESAVIAYIRAVERLESVMVETLSRDLKANLRRAHANEVEWFDYNVGAFRADD